MLIPSSPYASPFGSAPFAANPYGGFQPMQPMPAPEEQPREMSLPRVVNYLAK